MNGNKVSIDVTSTDQTDDVLEVWLLINLSSFCVLTRSSKEVKQFHRNFLPRFFQWKITDAKFLHVIYNVCMGNVCTRNVCLYAIYCWEEQLKEL